MEQVTNQAEQSAGIVGSERSADFVVRYVVTVPCEGGAYRKMMCASQGRYTFATREEAQAWIAGYFANNSSATLDEFGRDLQVRSCKCYPGHFDPMECYFDVLNAEADVEVWSKEDSVAAQAQGWDLFEAFIEGKMGSLIERCDETGVFADDQSALAFVKKQAEEGSVLAAKALRMDHVVTAGA